MTIQGKKSIVNVTTAADGSATVYSDYLSGKLSQISYVKTDFDNGSTFTITVDSSGQTVWGETGVNASATRAPRQATHSTAGAAATYDGTRAVLDKIAIQEDRIKIVIANGGNAKTGQFVITME